MPAAKLNASRDEEHGDRPSAEIAAMAALPSEAYRASGGVAETTEGLRSWPTPRNERWGFATAGLLPQRYGGRSKGIDAASRTPRADRSSEMRPTPELPEGSYPGSPGPGILPDTCSAVSTHGVLQPSWKTLRAAR